MKTKEEVVSIIRNVASEFVRAYFGEGDGTVRRRESGTCGEFAQDYEKNNRVAYWLSLFGANETHTFVERIIPLPDFDQEPKHPCEIFREFVQDVMHIGQEMKLEAERKLGLVDNTPEGRLNKALRSIQLDKCRLSAHWYNGELWLQGNEERTLKNCNMRNIGFSKRIEVPEESIDDESLLALAKHQVEKFIYPGMDLAFDRANGEAL